MTRGAAIISVFVALASLQPTTASAQRGEGAPRAQPPGGLSGYVVDARGHPIVGAHVLALGTPRMAVTGAQGEYLVDSVPAGQRRVRIRAPRFATLDVVLAVPSADLADLDVRLDSAAAADDSLAPPDAPDLRRRAGAKQEFDLFFTRPELDARHARAITDLFRGQFFVVGRNGDAWSMGTTSAHSVVTRIDAVPMQDLNELQHSVAARAAILAPHDECGHAWAVVLDGVPLEPRYHLDDIPINAVSALEVRLPVAHAFETPYGPESPVCGVVFVYTR